MSDSREQRGHVMDSEARTQFDAARKWLNEFRKPLTCINCGKPQSFGPINHGMAIYCESARFGTSGCVYEITIDPDAEVKMLIAYGAEAYEAGRLAQREDAVKIIRDTLENQMLAEVLVRAIREARETKEATHESMDSQK